MLMKLLSLLMTTASAEAAVETTNALVDMPLMGKGLLVTVAGLLGVFLVLFLFFLTIKVMQKIK